jgi:proline racemase
VSVHERPGVITSVQGHGFVTGYHTFVMDERDPLADGFLLR